MKPIPDSGRTNRPCGKGLETDLTVEQWNSAEVASNKIGDGGYGICLGRNQMVRVQV